MAANNALDRGVVDVREITAETFARLLKYRLEHNHRYAFFLGAGCSRSSGIKMAGDLVRHWIEEHHKVEGALGDSVSWARSLWDDYDDLNPAAHYGRAMDLFFPTAALRQIEIDRQVQGKNPGYGYAMLAAMLAHEAYGPQCNVVLTTNFDDLVADALYLFTRHRPLVITHSALSGFARLTSGKPLVVKLHGDVHLSPQNTQDETDQLHEGLESLFARLIHERGLIFMGYGANDKSILRALQKLTPDHIQAGIFWVSNTKPDGEFGQWLESRKAVWVKHLDFDEAMFLIRGELNLPDLDRGRFDDIIKVYDQKLDEFIKGIGISVNQPSPSPTDAALQKAARSMMSGKQDAHTLLRQALLLPRGSKRTEALRGALEQHSDNPRLLGALATELHETRDHLDEAEQLYRRALSADPNNAIALGNFANFLRTIREQHDEAEQMYRRAISADPNNAIALGNFASFLTAIRKRHDEAEQMFRRAIVANPNDATALGNFASFLTDIRQQHDEAEQLYRRAISADPNHAIALGNFAYFLTTIRKQHDEAEQLYRRAISADPNHANALGNFANFLTTIRKQYDEAEQMYRRQLEIQPGDPNAMGNYARLLFMEGRSGEGIQLLDQAMALTEAGMNEALALELWFYRLAHDGRIAVGDALREVRDRLMAGQRSPGWDLTDNVARAREDGHPFPDLLAAIAKVIADEAPLSSLDAFPEWRDGSIHGNSAAAEGDVSPE